MVALEGSGWLRMRTRATAGPVVRGATKVWCCSADGGAEGGHPSARLPSSERTAQIDEETSESYSHVNNAINSPFRSCGKEITELECRHHHLQADRER